MATLLDTRRYLTNFDSTLTGHLFSDVLVIGSGVAGARAAIEAARYGSVILITKESFDQSATHLAQGGVAAAMGSGDSADLHLEDTTRVGGGLNCKEAVRLLVDDAPRRLEELMAWGFQVDRKDAAIELGREGGHSVNRIVHANGDQTGRELVRTLRRRVLETPDIRIFEDCFLVDLLTHEGLCLGAVTHHAKYGHQLIWAKQTLLASGGCGQLWRETTNPRVATGDGVAAAFRAGADLRDMEMMQFHPTTLYIAGSGRALISEAVRGEGAYLVDKAGQRFMSSFHPDAELAPRDVVSRSIHHHLVTTRSNCVYLDVRHIKRFAERFPHIASRCADFQLDVTRDLIPVRPSAHYMIGGVQTAIDGSTGIEGLLCCGEASCNGVHGANRLASNSLLEGLVFGRLIGEAAGQRATEMTQPSPIRRLTHETPTSPRTELDLRDIRNSLRSLMWRNVGIERSGDRLIETGEIIDFWAHYTLDKSFDDPRGWEIQNELTLAKVVALSALERNESVGVHYRTDGKDEPTEPYHVTVRRDPQGTTARRVSGARV